MSELIGCVVVGAVALVALLVGASTLQHIKSGEVPTLSRSSDRLISRRDEPVGFWVTIVTGLFWFSLGVLLLALVLGDLFEHLKGA